MHAGLPGCARWALREVTPSSLPAEPGRTCSDFSFFLPRPLDGEASCRWASSFPISPTRCPVLLCMFPHQPAFALPTLSPSYGRATKTPPLPTQCLPVGMSPSSPPAIPPFPVCSGSCQPTQFRCSDGCCIDGFLECDDTPDCPDGSDEASCEKCEAWGLRKGGQHDGRSGT